MLSYFGMYGTGFPQQNMPVLNFYEEVFAARITIGENNDGINAVPSTSLGYNVVETAKCTDCATGKVTTDPAGAGVAVTTTATSGYLDVPGTTYTGVEGTATLCIYADGAETNPPTVAYLPNMPCIQNAFIHFADAVTTPDKNVPAYLGLALGANNGRRNT